MPSPDNSTQIELPIEPDTPEEIVEGFWAEHKLYDEFGGNVSVLNGKIQAGKVYQILNKELKGFKFKIDEQITDANYGNITIVGGVGNLTQVEIPKEVFISGKSYKVVAIGNEAFLGNKTLESVILPDGLTTIGDNSFAKCENLVSIVLPASLTDIGEYPFYNCFKFEHLYYRGTLNEWLEIKGDWIYPLASGNVIRIHPNYVG